MTGLALYRGATGVIGPLVRLYLRRRRALGKENPARLAEREGIASRSRPAGPLVWLHAASVGEAQSALALIDRLLARRGDIHVLVTSGTVTSANLLDRRLPDRALHQFVPVDLPAWVGRFVDHWRPDLALFMESELWPNLIGATAQSGCPLILVNGRLSARSFARWQRMPALARNLLGQFTLCLGQTEADRQRLAALGATRADYCGNLKYSADLLPMDEAALAALKTAVGKRPLWLAASTHPGEEEIVAAAHERLRPAHSDLLTVIAPRHPARGPEIEAVLTARGLTVTRRAGGAMPAAADDIYLADTLGELGLLYRLTGIAFIGGGMAARGGHNPLEAAQLGCAILHGPDMSNFRTVASDLATMEAAVEVADADALAREVGRLLRDDDVRTRMANAARKVTQANAGALDQVMLALEPFMAALPASGFPAALPADDGKG